MTFVKYIAKFKTIKSKRKLTGDSMKTLKNHFNKIDIAKAYEMRETHSLEDILKTTGWQLTKRQLSQRLSRYCSKIGLEPKRKHFNSLPTKEELQSCFDRGLTVTAAVREMKSSFYQVYTAERLYNIRLARTDVDFKQKSDSSNEFPDLIPTSKSLPDEMKSILFGNWRPNPNILVGSYFNI